MSTFLTALPKDEQVTGSRDPLGLLSLWSELGRQAIVNVTTVSSDMAGWVTLALGTHETRELVGDDDDSFLGTFLKVEQAIAYARCADRNERSVRGSNEVRRRLQRGDRQPLGADKKRQILVGQQTTGVWGQVSRPGRRSRLLYEHVDRLTDDSAATVEALLHAELGDKLRQSLRTSVNRGVFDIDEQATLVAALQELHGPRPGGLRQSFLRNKVLLAGGAGDEGDSAPVTRQRTLVGLLKSEPVDWRARPFATVQALSDTADGVGHKSLGEWLRDVVRLEQLLGPLERVFRYLLVPTNRTVSDLSVDVGEALGPLSLTVEAGLDVARRLSSQGAGFEYLEAAQAAIGSRDWPSLVVAVVERNRAVMSSRSRGAWIRRTPADRLEVDLGAPDDGVVASLPQALEDCWTHGYYLPELHRLVADIEGIDVG